MSFHAPAVLEGVCGDGVFGIAGVPDELGMAVLAELSAQGIDASAGAGLDGKVAGVIASLSQPATASLGPPAAADTGSH